MLCTSSTTFAIFALLASMVHGRDNGGKGPDAVNLRTAGSYTVLTKTGVTNSATLADPSSIQGDIGVSPYTRASVTGFGLTASGANAASSQVTGVVYSSDDDLATKTALTTAIGDLRDAYDIAQGRSCASVQAAALNDCLTPYVGKYYADLTTDLGGLTLAPGLYKFSTTVAINSELTIEGTGTAQDSTGEVDTWIFQIAQTLTVATGKRITLSGGAKHENIFWAVAGAVTLHSGVHFEGVLMSASNMAFGKAASLNGRALAMTAVTLIENTINPDAATRRAVVPIAP